MAEGKIRLRTVLVTNAERGSALAVIRSFSRKGWRVIAASADPLSPGFRSRHTRQSVLYPSPTTAALEFVESMLAAVRRHGVDLIVPVTGETIVSLAQQRHRFRELCQIAMPEQQILEIARNKLQTMELAQALGVPIPETFVVDGVEEAVGCAQGLPWPVVIKPAFSRKINQQSGAVEMFSVSYANDVETLRRGMAQYEGRGPVLLQAYYEGEGQGVELLACNGQPLAVFQHRRLCEVPVQGGASALRESLPLDPQLYEYARRLTEAMKWTGLLMVEFKVGEQGAKLMEINGRIWGSLPLASASGIDFPGRLADLYEGKRVNGGGLPESDYRTGVQAADEETILMWLLQVLWGKRSYPFLPFPSRRETLPVLRKLLSPRLAYDILALDDPGPGVAMLLKLVRKLFRKSVMIFY